MSEDLTKHKITLAQDLLDDIEFSRVNTEQLLLKASRLARLVDADEIRKWLRCELNGYYADDPVVIKYMDLTGRWTEKEKRTGFWYPLAELNARIAAQELQVQRLGVPNIHFAPSSANPNEWVAGFAGGNVAAATRPVSDVLNQLAALTDAIARLSGVRSRVLTILHDFVGSTYYQLAFSGLAESIFGKHKTTIDALLRGTAGDALEKIPAIYDRLAAGDAEAVSQALNTCRRVINAFADAVYPPGDGTINIDGNTYKVGADNYLNRIVVYLHEYCPSTSRRQRLSKTLRDLHDRVSAGVHADVTLDEAKSLFLQTYITLGEILSATADKAGIPAEGQKPLG